MPWPLIAAAVGGLLGKAAGGMSKSRENANQQALSQDRNKIDAYQAQQQAILQALGLTEQGAMNRAGLDLQQRNFALNAPSTRGRQALAGSLMENLQPVQLSGLPQSVASRMPTFSGGLSPAAIGPLAKQMGLLMQQNAVAGQQKGDAFDPVAPTDFRGGLLPGPKLAVPQKAGLLEKILGGIGLGGSLIGAVAPHFQGGGQNDFMAFDKTLTPPGGRG